MHSLLTKKFKRGCLIQFSRFWTKHFSDSFFWCDFCMLCWYFVGIMVEIRVSRNNFSLVAKNAPMLGVGGARKLLSIDLQTSMHSLITKKFKRGCLIQFLRFLTKHLAEIAVFLLSWESHSSCRFKGWHGQKSKFCTYVIKLHLDFEWEVRVNFWALIWKLQCTLYSQKNLKEAAWYSFWDFWRNISPK